MARKQAKKRVKLEKGEKNRKSPEESPQEDEKEDRDTEAEVETPKDIGGRETEVDGDESGGEDKEGDKEDSGTVERGKKRKKIETNKMEKTSKETCTVRDPLERVLLPSADGTNGRNTFTVLSWNVNGLRATLKSGLATLQSMVTAERPDLICFQETKLQEKDVDGIRDQDILPGYDSAWTCSTAKKGYAGSAVFFPKQARVWTGQGGSKDADEPSSKKRKQGKISNFFSARGKDTRPAAEAPKAGADEAAQGSSSGSDGGGPAALPLGRSGLEVLNVSFGIGDPKHDGEGRSITVEYEKFFVVTLYVPNSGQKLERLSYRTKEWDPALRRYVDGLERRGKAVVVTGDLNVAHLDLDIYNVGAKHLEKTAGTTKEERESFDAWMKEGKIVDAFRRLHPTARGAYTYWSVRSNARPSNKGLRLDYFLCSSGLFVEDGEEPSKGQQSKKTKGRRAGKSTPAEHEVSVHDCFQLDKSTVGLSDHCPVGLILRV